MRRVPPKPGLQPEYRFGLRERFPCNSNRVRVAVIRGVRLATNRYCSLRKPNSRPSSPGLTPGDGPNDNYRLGRPIERRLILSCGRSTASGRGDCACGDRPLLLCAGNRERDLELSADARCDAVNDRYRLGGRSERPLSQGCSGSISLMYGHGVDTSSDVRIVIFRGVRVVTDRYAA